jgi:CubicO group peptidase (beta-lactamase class C family)
VLIARASGQPVESFYRERIFAPLGMEVTAFQGPASRLAPCYQEVEGALQPFDDGGVWSRPRVFADCGAGVVSTVSDYLAFGQMLLRGGTHGGRRGGPRPRPVHPVALVDRQLACRAGLLVGQLRGSRAVTIESAATSLDRRDA